MSLFRFWNHQYHQSDEEIREVLFNFYYHRQLYAFLVALLPFYHIEPGNYDVNLDKSLLKNQILQNDVPAQVQDEIRYIEEELSKNGQSTKEALGKICHKLVPDDQLEFQGDDFSGKGALILLTRPLQSESQAWKLGILFL